MRRLVSMLCVLALAACGGGAARTALPPAGSAAASSGAAAVPPGTGVGAGRASGVVLESGEELHASIVVSNLDVKRTFLETMDAKDLPLEFVEQVRKFIAGASLPLQVEHKEGVVRWIHERGGRVAIGHVTQATSLPVADFERMAKRVILAAGTGGVLVVMAIMISA